MYSETIGLIGGFGGYATLNFYKRLLEVFNGESERDIPHIIIDNDFTMPSRTRSLLTGEAHSEIVEGICRSMELLLNGGADHIILVCGTAHFFLDDVYARIPEARAKVLDIIQITGEYICRRSDRNVFIMAAEGTLKQEMYPRYFAPQEISCIQPPEDDYPMIRYFLECVKQDKITEETCVRFFDFINKFDAQNVLLGCTELPVIVQSPEMKRYNEKKGNTLDKYNFIDPLEYVIKRLSEIIK